MEIKEPSTIEQNWLRVLYTQKLKRTNDRAIKKYASHSSFYSKGFIKLSLTKSAFEIIHDTGIDETILRVQVCEMQQLLFVWMPNKISPCFTKASLCLTLFFTPALACGASVSKQNNLRLSLQKIQAKRSRQYLHQFHTSPLLAIPGASSSFRKK